MLQEKKLTADWVYWTVAAWENPGDEQENMEAMDKTENAESELNKVQKLSLFGSLKSYEVGQIYVNSSSKVSDLFLVTSELLQPTLSTFDSMTACH